MIPLSEFAQRRQTLMENMGPSSVAVIASAPVSYRSGDVPWPYRQDSDFLYLTGLKEPNAVLVLLPGRNGGEQWLFCQPDTDYQRLWHGQRVGLDGAVKDWGMDDAFPIQDLDDILPGLLEGRDRLFYSLGRDRELDQRLMEWTRRLRLLRTRHGVRVPDEFLSLEHILHEMRLFKSKAEIAAIQQAVDSTVDCHLALWQAIHQDAHERDLVAAFQYSAQCQGLPLAYPMIVAGGENACVLHYHQFEDALTGRNLVLVDGGVEYEGYAADITRCLPPAGQYDAQQKAMLEIVLAAQKAAEDKLKPGQVWDAVHEAAVEQITLGLIDIGLLKGSLSHNLETRAYEPFFMTRTGHWLGLDVHDVGDYYISGQPREIEAGMVVALEPGLMIRKKDAGRKRSWYQRVMRVEDNYLVSKQGVVKMSHALPSKADEVEQYFAR